MQIEYPHAQSRSIEKLQVKTPLIVPSFSSRGFPSVGSIYAEMKNRLYGVCLVSASDLANGFIPADAIDLSNRNYLG